MKIAVISKADRRGGGASVVASQLTAEYQALGHQADHFHLLQSGPFHPHGRARFAIQKFKGVEGRLGYRDHTAVAHLFGRLPHIARDYDAVHLHDMSTTISHGAIRWLADRVPTIWTLHDCSPFTAGCLYPATCGKFATQCGPCPQLGNWPMNTRFDHTEKLHAKRKDVLHSNIHFSAPSKWMIGEYLRAGWPESRIKYIPNAVNRNIFKVRPRTQIRQKYGLESHTGLMLLFSAGWLHDERKGPIEAANMVRTLEHLDPLLVLVGRYSDEASAIFRGVNTVHFGLVRSDESRAELYGMCDGTLMFSRQENAPLTAIESLAVGRPVFGYATGGMGEIIENNHTGFLAPVDVFDETVRGVEKVLALPPARLEKNCLDAATKTHDYANVADQFIHYMTTNDRP